MSFSLRWDDIYFNVVWDISVGSSPIRSFFSSSPHFGNAGRKEEKKLEEDLKRYFSGEAVEFSFKPVGVSKFVERVLAEVLKIPYGSTRTYSEIARTLKTSPRAVGQAVKRNPLPVLIPCHRVVSVRGIGGYTVMGTLNLKIKEKLLKLEGTL